MIPNRKPNFNRDEINSIFLSDENIIAKFEKKFANLVGNKYALSFPSATSALYTVIKSLGISKKEILIPAYTSIKLPLAIVNSDNKLKFTDISMTDYNPTLDNIKSQLTKKTKCVILCYMYGYPMDTKTLREDIGDTTMIIDDAALALLTKNTGKFCDLAIYSLGLKQLQTIEGGIVTTNNEEIYIKLKNYLELIIKKSNFFTIKKILSLFGSYLAFNNFFYNVYYIWYEYRKKKYYEKFFKNRDLSLPKDFFTQYSKFQAKIGLSQIKKARKIIRNNKIIAEYYTKNLNEIKDLVLPPLIDGATYSFYTIRSENRNLLINNMLKKGIHLEKFFDYSIPDTNCYGNYQENSFPHSSYVSKRVINLPCYTLLIEKNQLEYIVNSIKKIIQ